jgi:hypothetical protein
MRHFSITLILATAGALGGLAGCASQVEFNSPSPLGRGVSGKAWRAPIYADGGLYTPDALTPAQALMAFDATSSGTTIQVAGTWHDQASSVYTGQALRYVDGAGFSTPGPAYGPIASNGGVSFGFPTIMSGPGGLFAAAFFEAAGGTSAVSALFTGNSWLNYPTAATLGLRPHLDPTTNNLINGPRVVSTMDRLGRGFVFFADSADGVTLNRVRFAGWQTANTSGIDSTLQDVSGADVSDLGGLTARFDGIKFACVTYELSATPSLEVKCVDISLGGAFDFAGATSTTLSSDAMAGHESATDGAGGIMSVFYQSSGGEYHVYANLGVNGAFEASPTRIDTALGDGEYAGYLAPSPTTIPGARPGVAHVGGGRFLAIWAGVEADSGYGRTQLFSALYTPATGWAPAAAIPGTHDFYSTTPHPQGLSVYGNGDGNAGFALNMIYTTDAIGPNAAVLPEIYAESAQARVTMVGRWQQDNGWLAPATVGNVCYLPAMAAADGRCSHRPKGVMFPSGNTVVLYMDRDNYVNAPSVGNYRLMATEFK